MNISQFCPTLVLGIISILSPALAQEPSATGANLAVVAKPSASYTSGDTTLKALNDGREPNSSRDTRNGSYGNWNRTGTQWVQYDWAQPISTKQISVYWWNDGGGVRLPKASHVKYWNGTDFVEVANAAGLGVEGNKYNVTTFDEVTTSKLRLEIDSDGGNSTGILEWKAFDSGKSPHFPPSVVAGIDRTVVLGGKTYLDANYQSLTVDATGKQVAKLSWSKVSGPGAVTFEDAAVAQTSAKFSETGDYVIQLAADDGTAKSTSTLKVSVDSAPPADRLDVVYTKHYQIDSPLWNARAKALITSWIPYCVDQMNRTDLNQGAGGIDNFVEAAKALRGEPHKGHKGLVFANAWVHQTVESMCIASMVDPKGDADIIKAQEKFKETLDDWIPKIIAAQEPDGYLQTAYTLSSRNRWPSKWNPDQRANHEGYTAGYFIESAINHYTMTDGQDKRLYDAAKKLADCWVANLGPGKKEWFDGHQEMEQALVRFGRFVNDMEGNGRGDSYVKLAKFLLDCRSNGSDYDQSHVPVQQQYEAVGHAVRATYNYSAMADVAAETKDTDYQSAVLSLWDNIVNKKYYVTGGIGSGESAEGFGPNYSLRNGAYCESCSTCGLIFFQWKMNLAYHDAKYADLYEESMYNALLGATDLEGKTFYYTNPLQGGQRTAWHVCPCCVGNIPRTLLMVPTWTYVKDNGGIYVNMYIGSTINVEKVAGTDVQMVQKTEYPWNGKVAITVNPKASRRFAVYVRVPDRTTSELYTTTPKVSGLKSLSVNGKAETIKVDKGYVAITRDWKAGDKIEFEIPMVPQRIKADQNIEADRGLVALRYGPLIYNVERADQANITQAIGSDPLVAEWRGDLLGGVMTLKGKWADGSPLVAIPNYARNNRLGQVATATVAGDSTIDYSGGATTGTTGSGTAATPAPRRGRGGAGGGSVVWIRDQQ
jgi:DUF1680 family protein